jgi:hypothetical protein
LLPGSACDGGGTTSWLERKSERLARANFARALFVSNINLNPFELAELGLFELGLFVVFVVMVLPGVCELLLLEGLL